MSLIPSVGATPPLPPVGYASGGENRQSVAVPAARAVRADASLQADQKTPPRTGAADSGESLGADPRAKGIDSVVQDKVDVSTAGQLAAKSGLVEGSFEPFIDIIDPRYQTRIARVFGPDASGPTPEAAAARVVSKAYEAAAKTAFAKDT